MGSGVRVGIGGILLPCVCGDGVIAGGIWTFYVTYSSNMQFLSSFAGFFVVLCLILLGGVVWWYFEVFANGFVVGGRFVYFPGSVYDVLY